MIKSILKSVAASLARCQPRPRTNADSPAAAALLQKAQELEKKGLSREAIDAYKLYLLKNRDSAAALAAIGSLYSRLNLFGEATRHFEQALAYEPDSRELLMTLGQLYFRFHFLFDAGECYEKILRQTPDDAGALNNLGMVCLETGDAVRAASIFRQALSVNPGNRTAHSNLLFCINYIDDMSPESIYLEHLNWAERFASKARPANIGPLGQAHSKIRVGYVSPNLKQHSVAYFIEPLLENHDRNRFEIYCYDDKNLPDETTQRLRAHADQWRVIAGLSDDETESILARDQLDIVVDLAGHTSTNRLSVFARRVAPIQVTYLGYPNTTGVSAMDYRITDEVADPAGMTDSFYCEKLVRVPCAWCYRPPRSSPQSSKTEPTTGGTVTFGSFNKLAKISTSVIRTWSRILRSVPDSNLFLKSSAFRDLEVTEKVRDRFSAQGVDPARIRTEGFADSTQEHLARYASVDIALDTFPYCGTTTTCEALYMGVPVITLQGRSHVSRVGASLLSCVGLSELIAVSEDEYIALAIDLAQNRDKRAHYRATLRHQMEQSLLMNGRDFSQQIEKTYREILTKSS